MHELSIALGIIEMAEEVAEQEGGSAVNAVHLRLGPLSGVVKDALIAAYDLAREGTTLRNSRLVVEETAVTGQCPLCGERRTLTSIQLFACPDCGAPISEILTGKELEVTALEIQS